MFLPFIERTGRNRYACYSQLIKALENSSLIEKGSPLIVDQAPCSAPYLASFLI